MNILQQILELILKLIQGAGDRARTARTIHTPKSRLDVLFSMNKFRRSEIELILLQDFDNHDTFNDWLLVNRGGEMYKMRVTGEGGDWSGYKKEYSWRSRFLPGQYKEIYQIGKFLNAPALKMIRPIDLYNLENGEVQHGGGCHVHVRYSKREKVKNSSAGCIVYYQPGLKPAEKLIGDCKASGLEKFDLTVFLKSDMPELSQVREFK